MNNLKTAVYLSGNMTPTPEHYYQWTNDVQNTLYEQDIHCYKAGKLKCHKEIVQVDLYMLNRSDIVLLNLAVPDINDHMTGAIVEVYEAWKQNKLVIAFTGEGVRSSQADSPWLRSFITKELDTMDEAVDYLLEHY